jgi:hypothetical protein
MGSDVYTGNTERVSKKRLDARLDFDEWANQVVAAVKTHRLRFGESARSGERDDHRPNGRERGETRSSDGQG